MAWTAQDEAELQAAEAKVAQLPKAKNPELSLGESAMAGLKKLPGQIYDVGADIVKAAPGFAMDVAKQAYIARPFGDIEEQIKQNKAIVNVIGNIASGVKNVGMGLGQQAINQLPENMRFGNVDTSAAQKLEKAAYDRYGNYRNIKNTMATDPLAIVSDVATVAGIAAPLRTATAAKLAAELGVKGAMAAPGVVAKASPKAIATALAARAAEPLSLEEAQLVDKYEKMGGHLRPGQYSPSNFIRQGDAVAADTPFPRVSGFKENHLTRIKPEAQLDEFGRFLSQTFGEDAPRMTEKVMQNADTRIGKVYDEVLPRNSVIMDPDLESAMGAIDERVSSSFAAMKKSDANRISAVMNQMRGFLTGDGLPGKLYQTYRARNGLLDEMAGSKSPVLQGAAQDMREALDDAFARQAKGQDGANLIKARQQYRALRTVKTLADKAPAGRINPGQVLSAVIKEYGDASKAGQLGTLGQVGAAFLKQMPSSGTAERSFWRSLTNAPFSEGIPAIGNAVVGLPVSAIGTRQVNKMINSPEMRAKLLARLLEQGRTAAPLGSASNMIIP
jgi:hypothetical protein